MSKHTPGPWKVDGNRVYTLNNRGVNHLDVQVFVGNGWAPHKDEQDADAALIAAAPDMLAELVSVRDDYVLRAQHYYLSGEKQRAVFCHEKADRIAALIARASGES